VSQEFLDFEAPIADLQAKIEALRHVSPEGGVNLTEEIESLEKRSASLTKSIFSNLDAWQVSQLARHPQRPHAIDYLEHLFTEFDELHGDRHYGDDRAIVGGLARLGDTAVVVIAQEKGRKVTDKLKRNFAMPQPEGYRKALRLMHMAERFHLPLITLIDTPGAYPGIEAEERGQSEAIATNLLEMSKLNTSIIAVVIGEGGSGGALAIGVADYVMMLQYSTYSVISPEGCASILWKDAAKAPDAAKALGLTSDKLFALKLIDEIVEEPIGGAHRDPHTLFTYLKTQLTEALDRLQAKTDEERLQQRYEKLMAYGTKT